MGEYKKFSKELRGLERRLHKSCKWAEEHRNENFNGVMSNKITHNGCGYVKFTDYGKST